MASMISYTDNYYQGYGISCPTESRRASKLDVICGLSVSRGGMQAKFWARDELSSDTL